MKTRVFIFAIVLVAIGFIGVWLRRGQQNGPLPQRDKTNEIALYNPLGASATPKAAAVPPTPRLFKSKRYPPETAEEKAMWEWWNTMRKLDSTFEWKMPIEFYGKVIDQFDKPIGGADVKITRSAIGGTTENRLSTDIDGLFSLRGVQGRGITVTIYKEGYLRANQSMQSFEYAEFFSDTFHVPDATRPVVFRLQKLMGAEQTYVFSVNSRATPDGSTLWLNVEKGKFESSGAVSFAVSLGDKKTRMGQEYTIKVRASNGTAIAPTSEEFPFLAPEAGYQSTLTLHQAADDPNYQLRKNIKLYAKLAGGRYAFIGMEVSLIPGGDVLLNGNVRYNQNWSRNLEFDHRKWINR